MALDASVNFFEEEVLDAVNFHQHFAAFVLFAQAQLVVDGLYVECLLEHSEVGQCREVADAKVSRHDSLIINANEHHEIFHAAHAPTCFVGLFLMFE
mgnify:CR=1 FL=1